MPFFNSLSQFGGFVGPYLAGYLLQRSGGIKLLCIILGAALIVAGCGILLLRHFLVRRERAAAAAGEACAENGLAPGDAAAAADVVKDVEAPGAHGSDIRKGSGVDCGVEMVGTNGSNGADTLVHRK
jgi:hypothetical protein